MKYAGSGKISISKEVEELLVPQENPRSLTEQARGYPAKLQKVTGDQLKPNRRIVSR